MSSDDRPPQGIAPQAFMPLQPSGPMHLPPPWGGWTPPPAEPKKEESHGGIKLAIQIIMAFLAVAAVIWAGGAASERLKHIEENQRAADVHAAEQKRQQDERDEKITSIVDRLERKVDRLTEQRQDVGERRHRRREATGGIDTRP